MIISLRQLELGRVHFDERYTLKQLGIEEPGLELPEGLRVSGDAELASAALGEIRLRVKFEGTGKAVCDRCLEPISIPLSASETLMYQPADTELAEGEIEVDEEDAEIGYYEGDGLDLADVAREQVLLALPMQKLCREDCQGICPACGANRNETHCQCETKQVDERWAALKNLRQ